MKKKVLILTLNDYIIYQPTILNLYDFLSPHFDVTVVSFKPEQHTKQKDLSRNIIYVDPPFLMKHLVQKTDFFLSNVMKYIRKVKRGKEYSYIYFNQYLPYLLKKYLRRNKPLADIIIAVDFPALCIAQQVYGSVHFLSLEIENNTSAIHKKVDRTKVKSVFIQSTERFNYLFPGIELPTFYVQNAPVFEESDIRNYEKEDFILTGAIDRLRCVFDCLDFVNRYPQNRLILKGGIPRKVFKKIQREYSHLLENNTVLIDRSYVPGSSFLDFLSRFRYGFTFYSWSSIAASFNYATAPSGKLFMNFAAGVPTIACNIPGFSFIEDFQAGILISDYKPETILKAKEKMDSDYDRYVQGCYDAAKHFSFDKTVAPYIAFLLKAE